MALVARLRLLDRHRQPLGPRHLVVIDIDHLRNVGPRVRIVAVGAAHAVVLVDRGVPSHRRRTGMATQAEVLPAGFLDLAVRVVACCAVEAVGTANLMWAGNLLVHLHVAVAAIADSWRIRAKWCDVPRSDGIFFVGRMYPWPPAALSAAGA